MSALAGGVAHDFNNILNAMLGYCELLLPDFPPDDPRLLGVRGVSECAERAAVLTRQLLAFSRGQVLKPEAVAADVWVSSLTLKLQGLLPSEIGLKTDLKAAPARVSIDRGQFEQVLVELTLNARDAIAGRGQIILRTEAIGPDVFLSVEDDGAGMSPEFLSRIFEPFFTTKARSKNPGLGLAAVYGIVGQSGGTIEATSVPGRGSAFAISLPRA